MPVVNLPPGCSGLQMTDGTNYTGKPGGHVNVADEHAPHIRREVGGDAGLVGHGSFRTFAGTRDGRWCPPCRFLAQAWSRSCPRCGGDTVPEAEMPPAPPSRMPSACLVPIGPGT
jgi:hypothetical protein